MKKPSEDQSQRVNCPHCGGEIELMAELAGQAFDCPHCAKRIASARTYDELPAPPPPVPAPPKKLYPPTLITPPLQHVIVKDFEMSFGSMVVFMIKWSVAAIPALGILGFVGFAFVLFLGVLLRALSL